MTTTGPNASAHRAPWRLEAARLQRAGIARAWARSIARTPEGDGLDDRTRALDRAAGAHRIAWDMLARALGILDVAIAGRLALDARGSQLAPRPWTAQRAIAARVRTRADDSPPPARLHRLALVKTTLTAAPPATTGRAGARAAA